MCTVWQAWPNGNYKTACRIQLFVQLPSFLFLAGHWKITVNSCRLILNKGYQIDFKMNLWFSFPYSFKNHCPKWLPDRGMHQHLSCVRNPTGKPIATTVWQLLLACLQQMDLTTQKVDRLEINRIKITYFRLSGGKISSNDNAITVPAHLNKLSY